MTRRTRIAVVPPESLGRAALHPSPTLRVVGVDAYLSGDPTLAAPGLEIVNLTGAWGYLTPGWYVSLLAEARGQTVMPPVVVMKGLQDPQLLFRALREAGVDVVDPKEMAARTAELPAPVIADSRTDPPSLRAPKPSEAQEVLVVLGRTAAPGLQRLAARVFRAWPMPALRVGLLREDERWKVWSLTPQRSVELQGADEALLRDALHAPVLEHDDRDALKLPSVAVLYDATDPFAPSTSETLDRLERIGRRRGLRFQRIGLDDLHALDEHDALFVRTLTGPELPSFAFAARAEALGLPAIDSPGAIVRCSNKIYLHELLRREGVPQPRTRILDRSASFESVTAELGSPYVIKLPDGSFSAAVFRVKDEQDHAARTGELFARSPLLVAQEYLPTPFDWRVTVLDGRVLFVAKYHMARGHWQIRNATEGRVRYGRVEAIKRATAPKDLVRVALKACRLLGPGLYGVDLKEGPHGPVVIEVNDNPNIDTGYDDAADGDVLFEDIVTAFERRIRERAAQVSDPDDEEDDDDMPDDDLAPLRRPIGRLPRRAAGHAYRAWEALGLELEYVLVDRDLNVLHGAEDALSLLAGRRCSDVELGAVAFSNELFDHVVELKTPLPLSSLVRTEEVLAEGVRRLNMVLAARLGAKLLPGGMHPWLDPKNARLWRRSNQSIYRTYARLFDVQSHGWANVQASHVNLPFGDEADAVAMMNAAGMLVPYLPAIAAASPLYDGELHDAVDNRLAYIVGHQARLPETCGDIVPEPVRSFRGYKRDVLGAMYKAVDAIPGAEALRREYLNARGAVFKFSRTSMEVRVLDVQECVAMDCAIASFTRQSLRSLARELSAGRMVRPDQEVLVADFREVIRRGSAARVFAPHLGGEPGDDGRKPVRDVLRDLHRRAARYLPREEARYHALVGEVIESGSLSERIIAALEPTTHDADAFTETARRIWVELCDCLAENRPWPGRGVTG